MIATALGKMSGITELHIPGGIVLLGDPAAPLLDVAAGISFLVFLALDCNRHPMDVKLLRRQHGIRCTFAQTSHEKYERDLKVKY
jgi:hypothetical protein